MRDLLNLLASKTELTSQISQSRKVVAPPPLFPFLVALRSAKNPLLVVTSSSRGAEDLANELRELHKSVYEFPAWETLPHEKLSPRSDTVARRIATLTSLSKKDFDDQPIVVAPVRAFIHRFMSDLAASPLQELSVGLEIELTQLIEHLTQLAYTRTDLVEKHGEFAVRGGILDLFLPLSTHPVRIDFFGDEIESISNFEVSNQRTSSAIEGSISILPCRELLLTPEIRSKAGAIKEKYPAAKEILARMEEGITTDGMESLLSLLVENTDSILDRMPKSTEVIFLDE